MVTIVSIRRALDGIARKGLTVAVAACLATAAVLATAAPASRQDAATGGPDGATLARRYFEEVWNRGQVDVLDELLAPEYVNHTPSFGNPPPGPNGLKPIVLAMRRAFPDLHFTIEDVVATPDAVAVRTTMTGTHTGDLFGTAPTYRRIKVMQIQIERVRGGRIVEHWRVTDELTLMRQLGVLP
jgi:predicted ester cyclase